MKKKNIVIIILLTTLSFSTSLFLSELISSENTYTIYFWSYVALFISLSIESWHWRTNTKSSLRNINYYILYFILSSGIFFYLIK
ncbi:hypothetical protein [uncultured Tenacibaculum sp.]|uniref:hypothetical protein n=1 Tax=uncultured Tenacibaculum sp. TaxID=174713 RepID=UPI0026064578|nr:hypothetical protein [uncultured Tenacibaculum sp.]